MSPFEIAWTVVGSVATLLVTLGAGLIGITPAEFRGARVCFITTAVMLYGIALVWSLTTNAPPLHLWITDCSIGIGIAFLLPASLVWVSRREKLMGGENPLSSRLFPSGLLNLPVHKADDGRLNAGRYPNSAAGTFNAIVAQFRNMPADRQHTTIGKDVKAAITFGDPPEPATVTGYWIETRGAEISIAPNGSGTLVLALVNDESGWMFFENPTEHGFVIAKMPWVAGKPPLTVPMTVTLSDGDGSRLLSHTYNVVFSDAELRLFRTDSTN